MFSSPPSTHLNFSFTYYVFSSTNALNVDWSKTLTSATELAQTESHFFLVAY